MTSRSSPHIGFLRSALAAAALFSANSTLHVERALAAEDRLNASCRADWPISRRVEMRSPRSCSDRTCYAEEQFAKKISTRVLRSASESQETAHDVSTLICTRMLPSITPTTNQ